MLLELLLRLLEPVVVYFSCYSCHNHATHVAPGSHLQWRSVVTMAAAAAIRVNESMFLSFLAFCCCHVQRQMQRKEQWLIFSPAFYFPTSISQLAEANQKLADKEIWRMLLGGRKFGNRAESQKGNKQHLQFLCPSQCQTIFTLSHFILITPIESGYGFAHFL